jgi:hypothetical protein
MRIVLRAAQEMSGDLSQLTLRGRSPSRDISATARLTGSASGTTGAGPVGSTPTFFCASRNRRLPYSE